MKSNKVGDTGKITGVDARNRKLQQETNKQQTNNTQTSNKKHTTNKHNKQQTNAGSQEDRL